MKVPTIFKGKTCKCGITIDDQSVKEIGIDFNTEQFILRFTCKECGFNGKLVFKTENKKVEDLCAEILNMAESSGNRISEDSTVSLENSGPRGTSMEELFCNDFYQNKLASLFIPTWTDELMREFERQSAD